MKAFLFSVLALTLAFCSSPNEPVKPPLNFKIEISEWAMMVDNLYVITPDSINIKYNRTPGDESFYTKKLSATEKAAITKALQAIDLGTLTANYIEDSGVDCALEYDFTLTVDSTTKVFHIYQTKQDEVFNLVEVVNRCIPKNFQIGYTEEYFRYE